MKVIHGIYSFLSQRAKLNAIAFLVLALIITIALNETESFDASMHAVALINFAVGMLYLLLVELAFIEVLGIIKSIEFNRISFSLNFIGFYSAMQALMNSGLWISTITEGLKTLEVTGFIVVGILLMLAIIFFILMNYFQLKEALSLNRKQTLAFMFTSLLFYLAGIQLISSITSGIQSMIFSSPTLYD